jgi:hypothetical protein
MLAFAANFEASAIAVFSTIDLISGPSDSQHVLQIQLPTPVSAVYNGNRFGLILIAAHNEQWA